ncbi:hypothetical protein GCM10029976_033300 [Kribbella albertanoniae]|uniref:Antibiotic biosynthesis monooxygenase n=1 Tax=Kribbella albertanoniae TaxID=1266829 RepID=A0A4R4QIQ2_9ACTN|nr:hypothetical protein [Kribbella albertanoniae]TDC35460.1 hypothetical protein E1261_00930 [Kribbella albertanoniae]
MAGEKVNVVRYGTKPGAAAENRAKVEALFAQLAAEQPEGLTYQSIELPDGQFLHISSGNGALLQSLSAFKEFQQAGLMDGAPEIIPSTVVGQYP